MTGAGPLSRWIRLCCNSDDGVLAKLSNLGVRRARWQFLFNRGNECL